MNTYVFSQDGRCELGAFDHRFVEEAFPGRIVVYSNARYPANQIWYDTFDQKIMEKSAFHVRVSPNTLTGIPPGTTARVLGETTTSVVVNDGALELDVAYPQTVRVALSHKAHIDQVFEVDCESRG